MLINQAEFQEYAAQGYNRIPMMREVLADLDTPLSIYLKLASGPNSYLLESVQGGEKWGRYSIIGLPSRTLLRVAGNQVNIEQDGRVVESITTEDPLEVIDQFQARYRVPEIAGLPRFSGGLVGYFGYDTVRYIEPHLGDCAKPDPIGNPDIVLMVSDEVVVFDNLAGRIFVVVHGSPRDGQAWERGQQRLDELVDQLARPVAQPTASHAPLHVAEEDFVPGFQREDFEEAVGRCKEYIHNGDIMQVVLSQRLSIPFNARPLDLYRALRTLNPSPYMYFMDLGEVQIVGSSPEILVRLEDHEVTVRPIAGTRPRGADQEEDERLEQELMSDPKELAEHLMLVDLGRNDVGRVARTGSVELTDKMVVERYSHVMHIVSNVTGELRQGMDALDVLRATFPAGTVSGAPKVRAMEIIDELEPVKRGIYSGAVGYIGWNGNMDTAIAIRTAVIKDGSLHIQAGAGIVADSVPEREWEETMNKGRAIFKAVEMVARGLSQLA
jgi:anthranilate synthase component 1